MYEYNLIDNIVDCGEDSFLTFMQLGNIDASLKKGKRVINLIHLNSLPEGVKVDITAKYGGGLAFSARCTEDGKIIHVVICDLDDEFTLQHEVAHVMLGHTKHYMKRALKGRHPCDDDVLEMEYEADAVAASIVGPLQAMYSLSRTVDTMGKSMELSGWFMVQKRLLRLKSMIP